MFNAGAGKDRADAAGGELLNRVVGLVCHVEIARAVKGQALGPLKPVLAKDRADAAAGELLNRVVAAVCDVKIAA